MSDSFITRYFDSDDGRVPVECDDHGNPYDGRPAGHFYRCTCLACVGYRNS